MAGNGLSVSQYQTDPVIPLMTPMLPSVYQEDCLSMMPPFLRLNPSASSSFPFFDPSMGSFLPGSLNPSLGADSSGTFTGTVLVGSELQPKEPEYHGDSSGMFCSDQIQQVYNSNDIQSLSNDNQQLANGAASTPISTEISNLEESTFKAGKLSVEQRKEKIHRYLKKRNERNFSKKIKYACRKTLADSRPRVRGRFAKNDEFGDPQRQISSNNEEDDYDEVSGKEEDDMIDSSDIFAHISGVNSFKCGYSIQSWI
ncbi:hypothetical protein V2J09_013447 [Rumex salicifolius]